MNDLAFLKSHSTATKTPTEMRPNYAQEQRIHLIDFLLQHYGFLQREQITSFFAVSPATATRDLNLYGKIRPGNMIHNPTSRRWERTESFNQLYSTYSNPEQKTEASEGEEL